jgi:hypothetical protein
MADASDHAGWDLWRYDNPDEDDADPLGDAMDECGRTSDGTCMLAGSEQCDFECPFRDGLYGEAEGVGS